MLEKTADFRRHGFSVPDGVHEPICYIARSARQETGIAGGHSICQLAVQHSGSILVHGALHGRPKRKKKPEFEASARTVKINCYTKPWRHGIGESTRADGSAGARPGLIEFDEHLMNRKLFKPDMVHPVHFKRKTQGKSRQT